MKIIYHGTDLKSAKNIVDSGINLNSGSKHTDFGPGFYTTDDLKSVMRWAYRKSKARKGNIEPFR